MQHRPEQCQPTNTVPPAEICNFFSGRVNLCHGCLSTTFDASKYFKQIVVVNRIRRGHSRPLSTHCCKVVSTIDLLAEPLLATGAAKESIAEAIA
jgi:hypothetical protein